MRRFALLGILFVTLLATDGQAAWPPAPGANMGDRANWPNDYDGDWPYLSFFPERSAAAPPLSAPDQALGASGARIDRAWTRTIGRPDVRIAIADSGIAWDAPDLAHRAALNAAEVKGEARPHDAADGPCGGVGPLAGYDCNGDGAFTMADYAADPRFTAPVAGQPCFIGHDRQRPGADRIAGDVNRNCVLDPGDLILLASDGVDDDANGHTDDICGWDFFKNDNDPYDDTRSGSGTAAAHVAVAEADNAAGLPGACPGCLFVPVRVGDGTVVGASDLAMGVVYAADSGARVVLAAVTTLGHGPFARAAIDYAYGKGTLLVAAAGDAASREHAMPASANHVLAVTGLGHDGSTPEVSTTFLAFAPSSNFGPHVAVSVSGRSAREAAARAAGIAGLAFSAAADARADPPLTAEEALQLFKSTADDVSTPFDPARLPPRPGFDLRFGYGRANAERIVEAAFAVRPPPEVDLVAPEWFTPVHAEQLGGPIRILGRVAASRAKTYDLAVQWAPGAAPAESDYRDITAKAVGLPPSTVSGGAVPLAALDPAQLDVNHPPEPDSARGEDARSISIRVRATAHYDGGDVVGEARRVVSIANDKVGRDADLLPGFPLALGAAIEGSPKLADIDGDGTRDIVIGDGAGRLHVLSVRSARSPIAELPGFPYLTERIDGLNDALSSEPSVPSYLAAPAYTAGGQTGVDPGAAREAIVAAPAVADVDGDGSPDIVFATYPGTIHVVSSRGQPLPGWPKRLPLVPSCPLEPNAPAPELCSDRTRPIARGVLGAPVVADIDGDRQPEIIVSAFDGRLWALRGDGSVAPGYPLALATEPAGPRGLTAARLVATPAVGDVDGDGVPEIIVGSAQDLGGRAPLFVVDGRGARAPSTLAGWPRPLESTFTSPIQGDGLAAAPVLADLDGDGRPEIVVQRDGFRPVVLGGDAGERAVLGAEFGPATRAYKPETFFSLFGQPSIADVDQDGVLDVVATGANSAMLGALAGSGRATDRVQHLVGVWNAQTGQMLPRAPLLLEDASRASHVVADVSGDEYPEVIVGSGGSILHATDACGREAAGFPKVTGGSIVSTAAVGDIDGDAEGGLEVVSATREGHLFAWHTRGRSSGNVQWESFHHDNANTGSFQTPLQQGTRQRAAAPLSCGGSTPPVERFGAGGGCMCDAGTRASSGAGLGAGLGVAGLLARRRRRAT